jgi:hypothetical protein
MRAQAKNGRAPRRVLVHGLVYFGQVFADYMTGDGWDFQYFPDRGLANLASMANALRRCDLVYQIGGRVSTGKFLRAAKLAGKDRIVMHWVGSDTLDQKIETNAGRSDPWVLNSIHHWADSPWIFKEVESLGISCELVPLPSARVPARPLAMPKEFSVLVYVPSVERTELYGLDMIFAVARNLPQISFELVGLRDGPLRDHPPNIRSHSRIANLSAFYERASVVWRPARHDGLSWMVLESLGYGRHVLWTYPFPGCTRVESASEATAEIQRLYELHKNHKLAMNHEGVAFIQSSEYYPPKFRKIIHSRLQGILDS